LTFKVIEGLMEYRNTRPRFGVPLTHMVIALFLAASAGGGLWFWLTNKNTLSASAELAFDPALAQRLEPDLKSASKPALALADSILNDQAIAGLAKQPSGATNTAANPIGEFRSNLELTQPSPTLLRVRFLGNDADRSAASANAVALTLTQWTPSQPDATAPAADAQPASPSDPPAQPATPATQAATPPDPPAQSASAAPMTGQSHPPSASSPPDHTISDLLGEISAQLAATDRQLDRLAGEAGSSRSNPEAAYTEYNQQRLLRSQVGAAEKKLNDARAQAGQANAGSGVNGRLDAIRQALASILHTGASSAQSPGSRGFGAAGTSADQLLRERAGLSRAIGVIDRERQAIAQTQLATSAPTNSLSNGPSPASSPPASTPPASAQPPASPQQNPTANAGASAPALAQPPSSARQTPPADDPGASTPQQLSEHPLSLVRLASPTPVTPLWPPILAGLVCGLLYLGGAARAYRRYADDGDYEAYYDEELTYPNRFVTPGPPSSAQATPPPPPPSATQFDRAGQKADARDAFARRIDSIVSPLEPPLEPPLDRPADRLADRPGEQPRGDDALAERTGTPVAKTEPAAPPVQQPVEYAETRDASTTRPSPPAPPVERPPVERPVEPARVQDMSAAKTERAVLAANAETTSRKPEPVPPFTSPQRTDRRRTAAFLWESTDEPSIHAQEEPPSEAFHPEPGEQKEDSFTDRLRKSLSQTEIGRQFEKS
jgi:hypothetical protein